MAAAERPPLRGPSVDTRVLIVENEERLRAQTASKTEG